MTIDRFFSGLMRKRGNRHQPVTTIELFFDLVFVFAVTQLSHLLLEHLSWHGVFQTALLLLAMWTSWIYTAWVTNWLDPHRRPVRLMLIVLMLIGLMMSTALPEAFGDRGLVFAGLFVLSQIGRTLFFLARCAGGSAAGSQLPADHYLDDHRGESSGLPGESPMDRRGKSSG